MAAATENDHDRKDHDPGAVIVKDVAQAVIHYVCLRELVSALDSLVFPSYRALINILCRGKKQVNQN